MPDKRKLGRLGEFAATQTLLDTGYMILHRNFRYGRYGEIDLVARKDGVLCFIEVKARAGTRFGTPAEAVGYSKRRKIINVANHYLNVFKLHHVPVRFDIIEVYMDIAFTGIGNYGIIDNDAVAIRECRHIKNAFGAE